MNKSPSEFEIDKENYLVDHGSMSLTPFVERETSRLVVVKQIDADNVQIVEVGSLKERTVSQGEFGTGFGTYLLDEMVFYFGSSEANANTVRLLDSVEAAIKYCLYGKPQVPALTSA